MRSFRGFDPVYPSDVAKQLADALKPYLKTKTCLCTKEHSTPAQRADIRLKARDGLERSLAMLWLRNHGLSYKEIGRIEGISTARARQILLSAELRAAGRRYLLSSYYVPE